MTRDESKPRSELMVEVGLVLGYAMLALRPSGQPPRLPYATATTVSLDSWDDASLARVVEEGRREIDRVVTDVDRFRTRGQVVFTTALALMGIIVASLQRIINDGGLSHFVAWALSLAVGALGAAAAFGSAFGRTDLKQIRLDQLLPDPAVTASDGSERRSLRWLAEGYMEISPWNSASVSGLVTVVRDAVFLIAVSALLYGGTMIALSL
jgi:hypothetical protein